MSTLPDVAELRKVYRYDPASGHVYYTEEHVAAHEAYRLAVNGGRGRKVHADVPLGAIRKGYLVLRLSGRIHPTSRVVALHRLAYALLTGAWPAADQQLDHINGDRKDNRAANLRLVTNKENSWNQHDRGRALPLGVSLDPSPSRRKYVARIMVDGVQRRLGHFTCPKAAAAAYQDAKARLHHVASPCLATQA